MGEAWFLKDTKDLCEIRGPAVVTDAGVVKASQLLLLLLLLLQLKQMNMSVISVTIFILPQR
jgi:hypothetical protein